MGSALSFSELLASMEDLSERTAGDIGAFSPSSPVEDVGTLDPKSLNQLFASLREALTIQAAETRQLLNGRNVLSERYTRLLKENDCLKAMLVKVRISFIHPSIDWSIDLLIYSLVYFFIYSFIQSYIVWTIYCFTDQSIHLLFGRFIDRFIHSFIHWVIDWLTTLNNVLFGPLAIAVQDLLQNQVWCLMFFS